MFEGRSNASKQMASARSVLGEVQRDNPKYLSKGATKLLKSMVLGVLGSEGTSDQFWQISKPMTNSKSGLTVP